MCYTCIPDISKYIVWHLVQIIHKIKLQTSSDIAMTPGEICDRIFELVDQNNDGELGENSIKKIDCFFVFVIRSSDLEKQQQQKHLIQNKLYFAINNNNIL